MKFRKFNIEDVPMQTTSLIDIVFLLLIFFIVSSQYKNMEVETEVTLPIADSASVVQTEGVDEITLNVTGKGNIKVGGEVFSICSRCVRLPIVSMWPWLPTGLISAIICSTVTPSVVATRSD